MKHDARDANVDMPPLPEPPQFADARGLRELGNLLSGTANAEAGLLFGPLTAGGKRVLRKKQEENSYVARTNEVTLSVTE